MRDAVLAVLLTCSTIGALAVQAPAGYMLQNLPGAKSSFLLHTWNRGAMDMRANGFQPKGEAVGDHAFRLKDLASMFPALVAEAKIIGMCEGGQLTYDKLQEPHASVAARLSKTRLMGALSAGKGSALAFVSEWPDHVSIDACVINPNYLVAGEEAEAALITYVAQQAVADGFDSVRLKPVYQVDGGAFYERCGFFADEGASENDKDRILYYRAK